MPSRPILSFNTQPPEGGWVNGAKIGRIHIGFNTQPPEGGWTIYMDGTDNGWVSTHSRPKAAGDKDAVIYPPLLVSTHSRPKAAGFNLLIHF